MKNPPFLSLIVPVYRGRTIFTDLRRLEAACLDNLTRPFEIICVVDGLATSRDKTFQEAQRAKNSRIHIIFYEENKGKGYAVRTGMRKAKGDIIGFIDAGNDIDPQGIFIGLHLLLLQKVDVVIGSKRHSQSVVKYPILRRIYSRFLQILTKIFFGFNVADTQVGLKLFTRKVVIEILPLLTIDRWAFDIEFLAHSYRLGFKKIIESPVRVTYNFSSTVNKRAVINFFVEFFHIFYMLKQNQMKSRYKKNKL